MGTWSKRLRFQLIVFTVTTFVMPNKYLQTLSSAIVIPPVGHSSNTSNNTYSWNILKAKCRFGSFQSDGSCICRSADCAGFGKNTNLCMSRDSGNHWDFPNACYMLEHACNSRKKRLFYWKGHCNTTAGEPRDASGEFCEGDDVFYCKNDGICKYVNPSKERRCLCKTGYRGEKCEKKLLSRRKRYHKKNFLRLLQRKKAHFMMNRMFRFRTRRSAPETLQDGHSNNTPNIT
uniref:uncharacterized protein LOC120347847 isoform X1 n=1 Tax=Styela clava TaxID=7725 RepID=UPI0019394B2D|nr:uncharacterized protein LOC120347847 isoform X1 [Styela clava]